MPTAGIRSASIMLRGDEAASLNKKLLARNRSGMLPAPPRGIRSASIIELDRAKQGVSNAVRFYGAKNNALASGQSKYEGVTLSQIGSSSTYDSKTPLSPAAISSGIYHSSELPPPPPGIRPAKLLISERQIHKIKRGKTFHKGSEIALQNNGEKSLSVGTNAANDDPNLERWIQSNIPLEVLRGDASETSTDPSGPLLQAHLSAKSSWEQRQQKGGTHNHEKPDLEVLSKSPFKDYDYKGMEHPEVWVPSGSGPSSFHRQKLIEAKSALKMLKGSAKQRKTSGVNKERSVVKPRPQSESWPIAVPQSMSPVLHRRL